MSIRSLHQTLVDNINTTTEPHTYIESVVKGQTKAKKHNQLSTLKFNVSIDNFLKDGSELVHHKNRLKFESFQFKWQPRSLY
jgi:hypothetical protein